MQSISKYASGHCHICNNYETLCRFVQRVTNQRHVSVWGGCREGSDAHCKASAHLMCWSEKSWQSRGRQVLLMSAAECQNSSKGIYCTWCIYSRVSGHACSRSRTRLRAVGSEEHTFLLVSGWKMCLFSAAWRRELHGDLSYTPGVPVWWGAGTGLLRNEVGI